MQLRDKVYKAVDGLDERSLRLAFDYIVSLPRQPETPRKDASHRYSLEELDTLLANDKGDWGRLISEAREDRV